MNKMRRLLDMRILVSLALIVFGYFPAYSNLRIMTYNIENFWLRFDGESGTITSQGAELDEDDLEKLEIIASIINEKEPDVIGILECASLGELIFFNERFLEENYRCWSFRAYDSRSYGIPLGIMVKKDLEVRSVELVEPRSFSSRGIIVADIAKDDFEFTLILVHFKSRIENNLGDSALKRDRQGERLREIIAEKLQDDSDANIIICGDFNDLPEKSEHDDPEKECQHKNVEILVRCASCGERLALRKQSEKSSIDLPKLINRESGKNE